jgi:hypothetical protein
VSALSAGVCAGVHTLRCGRTAHKSASELIPHPAVCKAAQPPYPTACHDHSETRGLSSLPGPIGRAEDARSDVAMTSEPTRLSAPDSSTTASMFAGELGVSALRHSTFNVYSTFVHRRARSQRGMTALGQAALRQLALKVPSERAGPAAGADALAIAAPRLR